MTFNLFETILFVASIIAAGVAALSGFGIGSILTPLLAAKIDMGLSVAAVSIPHIVATSLRCFMLRHKINREVLLSFGTLSALGGLVGAFFLSQANNPTLTILFALLLLYVGLSGITGFSGKLIIDKKWSILAGLTSGLLGGLVGNQGGIRAAALSGMELTKEELVATATAIGVLVDLARMPVYIWSEGEALVKFWLWIALATLGCVIGTFAGKALLSKLSESVYRKILFLLIFILGIFMGSRVI